MEALPAEIERILKCLRKDPAQRFQLVAGQLLGKLTVDPYRFLQFRLFGKTSIRQFLYLNYCTSLALKIF